MNSTKDLTYFVYDWLAGANLNPDISKYTGFVIDIIIISVIAFMANWITKKIINDPGGLHNRVTESIHLHPFTLSETHTFLNSSAFE